MKEWSSWGILNTANSCVRIAKVSYPRGGPTMLYLAIDQHGKQLTVNLRDEEGTVLVQRQVRHVDRKF